MIQVHHRRHVKHSNERQHQCVLWSSSSSVQLTVLVLSVLYCALANSSCCAAQNVASGFDSYHTCVVMQATSGLRCCGGSMFGEVPGQVGAPPGTTTTNPTMPSTDSMTNVAEVSTGYYYTCVRTTSGGARCWGSCDNGQCGLNIAVPQLTIPSTDILTNVRRIYAGAYHTCAIVGTNALTAGLRCWGNNAYGQLGQGVLGQATLTPPPSDAITGVVSVGLGSFGTCIVLVNSGLRCWGDNSYNSVGAGIGAGTVQSIPSTDLFGSVAAVVKVRMNRKCLVLSQSTTECFDGTCVFIH